MPNHNTLSYLCHRAVRLNGYWNSKRELGTMLMLMVTEVAKLFDVNRVNKPEKLADIAIRLYDYLGHDKVDLTTLPDVSDYGMWDMINALSNEMETYRADINNVKYIGLKQCLSMTYKYADAFGINLNSEISKKLKIMAFIKSKKV